MRLLLAEDEVELSNSLTKILKRSNYTVDQVFDGEDALYYLTNYDYDLAVLDIMMPKRDGISVLKEVRLANNDIPIIMLTAKTEIDDKVKGLNTGADDYLAKPFNVKELLARLSSITRRKKEAVLNTIEFGNTVICYDDFSVSTEEGKITLTQKEFQVLELLFINKVRVTSTETILEKISDQFNEADINVVWVYLSNIRKKLKGINSNVVIRAKRGIGYMLMEA